MNTLLTRLLPALLIALVAGAAGYGMGAQDKPKPAPVPTLKVNEVARVGQSVITAEDFIERLLQFEKILIPDRRNGGMVYDDLIAERMLQLEAERIELTIKPREIGNEQEVLDKAFKGEFQRWNDDLLKQQRERGIPESPRTWLEFLRDRFNMNDGQYRGFLQRMARLNLLMRLLVNHWEESTECADAMGLRVESKQAAADLLARAKRGESLANLARNNSNDTRTRDFAGRIGTVWPKDGRLDAEVDAAFWKLNKGQYSEPIETREGWWIVLRGEGRLPNEAAIWDVRDELLKRPNVDRNRFQAWRNALAASGRYAYERRMPGWDVAANEP
ncbi:MAG: peptidylprolyl isomerase [Planctomycetes bacterium]|nr:peptidylprolyl isomerase [Planctomycetota bacterium]MCW8137156.1 peptidylprolyl isomerase [Planctomycetota bacterium]